MKSVFRDWSDVRVFLAVMREGSTLAAARVLGQAQPTVARRIVVLEHALGLALFVRSTKGFAPTEAALALLPRAEAMETAAKALAEDAQRQRNAPRKPIRLSVTPNAITANLTTILSEFRAAHPGTSFDFVTTIASVDLIGGEADVALRYAQGIDDERLFRRKLGEMYVSFYASQSYIDRDGMPASADDLEGHSFVLLDRRGTFIAANDWLAGRVRPGQILARLDDFESLTAAVLTGMGIGPLGRIGATRAGLVRCFDPPDPVLGGVWLVTGPDAHRRPDVRAFEDFFAPRYAAFVKAEREAVLGPDPCPKAQI